MRQDEDRIGAVILGKGYTANSPKQNKLVPRDRLIRFLNVAKDEEKIKTFCNRYKLIPNNLEGGLVKGFLELQSKIKRIVDRAINAELTASDLQELNDRIAKVHPKLVIVDSKQMQIVNENLHKVDEDIPLTDIDRLNRDRGIAELRVYPSIEATLYWDVVNFIVENKAFRNCRYCAVYFQAKNKAQKYCSKTHKDIAHEKRRKRTR